MMKTLCRLRTWISVPLLLLAATTQAAGAQDRAELLQKSAHAKKLIVRIFGDGLDGAGIVFAADASYVYGVTAKHVLVGPGNKPRTGLRANFRMWHQALPVEGDRFHPRQDLAAFKIDVRPLGLSVSDLKLALALDQLGATANLDSGDAIYTIGHATGGAWLDSNPGRFIGREEFMDPPERDTLKLDHFCPPGHSGGGVFDASWRLIGMIFDNQEPFCRALQIETVLSQVHDWKYEIQLQRPAESETAPAASRGITVAVIDFDNRSSEPLPDIGAAACDLVTSFLFNMPRVTVVTRDRLRSVQREQKLTPTLMSTTEGKSRIGRLVDADAIVTGSVSRYDVERRTVRYRDTSMLSDTYRMSINLQIIDIDSGVVHFSKDFDVERITPYPDARSAPRRPLSRESELLRELLEHQAQESVQGALREITSGLSTAGKLIAVAIRSQPEGGDVTISGIYHGKTPLDIDLSLGIHEIEIKLPGYAPWRHRVNIGPDAKIEAILSPGR